MCVSLHMFLSFLGVCFLLYVHESVRERKDRITSLLFRDRVGLPGERYTGRGRAKAGGVTGTEIEKQ